MKSEFHAAASGKQDATVETMRDGETVRMTLWTRGCRAMTLEMDPAEAQDLAEAMSAAAEP